MLSLCADQQPHADVMTFSDGLLTERLQASNIHHILFPMPEAMSQVRREDGVLSVLRAIPSAFRFIKNISSVARRYQVIVAMSQKAFVMLAIAKPFIRKPLVWYMNDLVGRDSFSPLMIKVMIGLGGLFADHIVFNSEASQHAWKRHGGRTNKTSVSYSGIDVAEFDKQLQDKANLEACKKRFSPDGKPLVGIFGRISPWKGQDVFIEALSGLPEARGVIVGDALFGEERYAQSLRDISQRLNMADRITFAGHSDDIAVIMAACDIVAHCSTTPEPFGRVIVEAGVAGTPVIATNAGGAKEIVQREKTGLLTEPGNVEELVAAIKRYLENPDFAAKMARAARVRAEETFSATAMQQQFRDILFRVCAS